MDVGSIARLGESLALGRASGLIGELRLTVDIERHYVGVKRVERGVTEQFATAEEDVERRHGDARRVVPMLIRAYARFGMRTVLVGQAWSWKANHDRKANRRVEGLVCLSELKAKERRDAIQRLRLSHAAISSHFRTLHPDIYAAIPNFTIHHF